jgi:hypothetical protein
VSGAKLLNNLEKSYDTDKKSPWREHQDRHWSGLSSWRRCKVTKRFWKRAWWWPKIIRVNPCYPWSVQFFVFSF